MVALIYLLRLPRWQLGLAVPLTMMLFGIFLMVKGWRASGELPTGLSIGPAGVTALAGDDRVWVIDWADLDQIESSEDRSVDGGQKYILKLSARAGGKSQFIVGGTSHDGFEVTVDERVVRDPIARLAAALTWYRDHPESRSELERTICIRHRLETLGA
ncbi:MAG: hypothetical protein AAB074_04725 [Planctomycetota bacterium]